MKGRRRSCLRNLTQSTVDAPHRVTSCQAKVNPQITTAHLAVLPLTGDEQRSITVAINWHAKARVGHNLDTFTGRIYVGVGR